MSLVTIRVQSTLARAAILAFAAASVVLAFFFAKWTFANAVSTRSSDREVANLIVSLGPDDPQTHYAAAVLADRTFDQSDIAISLAEYEKAVALSPNNYLTWLELAKARDRHGDRNGAEAAFRRALDLAPNYADVQWAFGNSLVRAGRADEGFALIQSAAIAKPAFMPVAVTTTLGMFDNDLARVRSLLGNGGAVNLALARSALAKHDLTAAADAWRLIPADEKRAIYRDEGRAISAQLFSEKQFRLAVETARDIAVDQSVAPAIGVINNGGFETLDLNNTDPFDWQIAAGTGQQIGLSPDRKTDGRYSLYMIFNTLEASDLRQVSQTVAVEPGVAYTFSGQYRADVKGAVAWEIADAVDGKVLGRTTSLGNSADWGPFRIELSTPPGHDGIVIRLVRDGCVSPGCPISGKMWFDGLKLSVQQ